ncbi:hypothetical protein K6U56_20315 [Vibrio furnissii]|nr:hypothetical protein [Vibrio furnissii]MCG6214292.1 hypothetical protein [Vibrio furnissii]
MHFEPIEYQRNALFFGSQTGEYFVFRSGAWNDDALLEPPTQDKKKQLF